MKTKTFLTLLKNMLFLMCCNLFGPQLKAQFYMANGASVTIQSTASIYLLNVDFQTAGTSGTLTNNGDIHLGGSSGSSNFNNGYTTLTQSGTTGVVHFENTGVTQRILGNPLTGTAAFNSIEINNGAGLVDLATNIEIKNQLQFNSATMSRLRTNTSAIGDGSSASTPYEVYISNTSNSNAAIVNANTVSGSTSRFIEGRLRWNLVAGTMYTFPVGTMLNAAPSGAAHYGEQFTQVTNSTAGDVSASFTELYGPVVLSGLYDCIGHIAAAGTLVSCIIHHGHWNIIDPAGSSMSVNLQEFGADPSDCQAGTLDHTFVTSTNNGSTWTLNGNNYYCYTLPANPGTGMNGLLKRIVVSNSSAWYSEASSVTPILPIQLVTFTAEKYRDEQESLLNWSTATEQNSKQFEVQWSTNGIAWQTVGTLDAAGNSATEKDYSFIHISPSIGVNYYQLKEVDMNGNVTFSEVREVMFIGQAGITIAPNPTFGYVEINSIHLELPMNFEIYNSVGQRIATGTLTKNAQPIQLPEAAGIYFFRFYGSTATVIKVVKQ